MRSRYIAVFLCLAILLIHTTLFAASACNAVLDKQTPNAVILVHGKKVQLSADKKTRLDDCSQLEFAGSVVHLIYEQKNGETRRKTCDANSLKDSCSIPDGKPSSVFDPITYEVRAGGKKMDEEFSRLPGIPHGKVFSVERAATLNLGKAGFTRWNLTLTEAGGKKPLYQRSGSDPVVQVPSNLLRPGGKYALLIDGSNRKYKGGFDILGGSEAEDIAGQLRQASTDASVTARGRKLDELIIFYENHLNYEVELLRDELQL